MSILNQLAGEERIHCHKQGARDHQWKRSCFPHSLPHLLRLRDWPVRAWKHVEEHNPCRSVTTIEELVTPTLPQVTHLNRRLSLLLPPSKWDVGAEEAILERETQATSWSNLASTCSRRQKSAWEACWCKWTGTVPYACKWSEGLRTETESQRDAHASLVYSRRDEESVGHFIPTCWY